MLIILFDYRSFDCDRSHMSLAKKRKAPSHMGSGLSGIAAGPGGLVCNLHASLVVFAAGMGPGRGHFWSVSARGAAFRMAMPDRHPATFEQRLTIEAICRLNGIQNW